MLGLVYLSAFASFMAQASGLIGEAGLLPIRPGLEEFHRRHGEMAYTLAPTFLWFGASDEAIRTLCIAGCSLSVLLLVGLARVPVLIATWACWLSVVVAGQRFLEFQWDVLLLEVGFLAIFLAPCTWGPGLAAASPTPPVVHWAFRWLLCRFMLSSGFVKLLSQDEEWIEMTALRWHYETQPLPTWPGWWAHQLPLGAQQLGCVGMFAVEILGAAMVLGPRKYRAAGGIAMICLMVGIMATGNYTYFNLLTIALCVLLIDDTQWPGFLRRRVRPTEPTRAWSWWSVTPVCVFVSAMGVVATIDRWGPERIGLRDFTWPGWVDRTREHVYRYHLVNGYGLFEVMTRPRHEIVLEGSSDGKTWKEYEFRWKPGDLSRAPRFVAPHQPRLDWQMWFAALNPKREEMWFMRLAEGLLEGRKEVIDLLGTNPFPEKPPYQVRALYYTYRFTTREERARTGRWWERTLVGAYTRPLSLKPQPPERYRKR